MSKSLFEKEFIAFQGQLESYVYRLIGHREETQDLVQDTFIKASDKLSSFKGNSSIKTWVFAIATNLSKDSLRARQRWGEDWMDLVRDAHVNNKDLLAKKFQVAESSPHGTFVMKEHLNYCFTCVSKTLLLRNQICLWLKEVYDFKVSEIITITGLSEGKVKHAIAESRKDLIRIFKGKCALINKNGTCSQCTGLNNIFNPEQNSQIESNKLKLVKEQKSKAYDQLLDLRLQMVKSLNPLEGEGRDLHNYLLENSPDWALSQMSSKD